MRELSGDSSLEDRRLEKITMSYSHFWVDFATLMTMINPLAVIPLYLSVTIRERKRPRQTQPMND